MPDERERDSDAGAGETAGLWRWVVVPLAIFGILALIVVALYVGAGIYLRRKALAGMSPDEIKEYEEWISKELTFDPADLEAPPFSDATVRAAQDFVLKWEDSKTTATEIMDRYWDEKRSGTVSTATATAAWNALRADTGSLEPLVESFCKVVNQPDYEVFVLAMGEDPTELESGLPVLNWLSFQLMAKSLLFQADGLAREGRYAEAFERSEIIVRSAKTSRFSILIEKLVAIAAVNIGTRAWHEAVEWCDDPVLLRETLERQNALAPKVEFVPRDVSVLVLDHLGEILAAKRYGIMEEVQGLTGWRIMCLVQDVQARFLEEIVLPALAHDPVQQDRVRERIDESKESSLAFGNIFGGVFARTVGLSAVFYGLARPNALEAYTRDDVARTRFDLLRLYTASKLFRLEHRVEVKDPQRDLVPAYLPEMPKDLFAKDGRTMSLTPVPYSIGPDGVDQGAALPYDPSNGTTSAGDLFFK